MCGDAARKVYSCIIDSPPQRSQISLTVAGAADWILIPSEVSSKGINSICRTLDLISEQAEIDAFNGQVLGVLPFRDRWVGRTQTTKSRESIETIKLFEKKYLPEMLLLIKLVNHSMSQTIMTD